MLDGMSGMLIWGVVFGNIWVGVIILILDICGWGVRSGFGCCVSGLLFVVFVMRGLVIGCWFCLDICVRNCWVVFVLSVFCSCMVICLLLICCLMVNMVS